MPDLPVIPINAIPTSEVPNGIFIPASPILDQPAKTSVSSDATLASIAITAPEPVLPPPTLSSQVTNAGFIAAIFSKASKGAHAAACSKPNDPTIGVWVAKRADQAADNLSAVNNNYFNCSSFNLDEDSQLYARKDNFACYHLLMLDDIGTKVPLDRVDGFEFSYVLETSPGNFQAGIILAEPITNGNEANRLLNAVIAAGLCDAGATGAQSRWARLPVGINGKAKHVNSDGKPFQCRLVEWNPERVYTTQEIVDGLNLELAPLELSRLQTTSNTNAISDYDYEDADDVFTPKSAENPVITAFKSRGLYETPLGSGKHRVINPLPTEGLDQSGIYSDPDEVNPIGSYYYQNENRETNKIKLLLEFLGIQKSEAKHKAVIRIVDGELHSVVNAAEKELAKSGRYYQFSCLIVSISTNPETGDPSIVPTNIPSLTRVLSHLVSWEKYNTRLAGFVASDPSARHISILYDSQTYAHLPHLKGVARQPYFRESDGKLVTEAGYDKDSQLFGIFDSRKFLTSEPNLAAANLALQLLIGLLSEFGFNAPNDKAAALAAIFTAVVRPSFAYSPGFHVKASTSGSGKSYLCDLISAFAKPGETKKVSYPVTSEEATKTMLSLLLSSPAVIEFDDMTIDWISHGIINRIFTSEFITDRILGVSKTATVSTRTLFLASGNNVGPVRDLLRRVLTINIDHRCATPATKSYSGKPVDDVRKDRGRYVAAVLTIILAWKAAGSPRADVENIVTYGGAWSDFCRHPLIWLGLADPATALLEQVKHDPDADALLTLMAEWHRVFGSRPTTVRKVIAATFGFGTEEALHDAICEFPVEERGSINASKFGWILKKNVNRIVGNYSFQQSTADGRVAWMVVKM